MCSRLILLPFTKRTLLRDFVPFDDIRHDRLLVITANGFAIRRGCESNVSCLVSPDVHDGRVLLSRHKLPDERFDEWFRLPLFNLWLFDKLFDFWTLLKFFFFGVQAVYDRFRKFVSSTTKVFTEPVSAST